MQDNSTTNALLTILIVVIVGVAVWFFATRYRQPVEQKSDTSSLQIDITNPTPEPAPSPTPAAQ